jgi:hypothetical protein
MQNHNHNRNHTSNPFSPQHPVQPVCFADRKNELRDFKNIVLATAMLDPPAPLNYAILGTWGQGKTSLLYKFRQIALEELKEVKCVCIYFPLTPQDCKNWEVFTDSFLRNVKSTANATGGILPKISENIGKWELSLNLGPISAQRRSAQEPPKMLDALQTLWEKHLKPSEVDIAFVLLDDLHYFPIRTEESAYLTLRATFQELVNRGCNYSLIVTAPSLLFSEIADTAEPVVRFFKRFDLKPFTFEDAKEAIRVRLKVAKSRTTVDDEVIDVLTSKTQGHPYLIMFAMFELLNLVNRSHRINVGELAKHWPVIEASFDQSIFEQKYQTASEKERELMIKIAELKQDFVSPSDLKELGSTAELFSRLEKKELLIRHGRGKYILFHPMFVEFLKKQ